MARYTPSGQVTTIPQNQAEFEKIQTAIDDTLSRKGDTPNGMEADLDMNSNRILNLPAPSALTEPLRLSDLDSFLGGNLSIDLSSVTKVIDNVDTMKGDSTLNSGDVVLCKKYYSGGDLVEGLIYEFQSSGTADGYIDHATVNGVAKLIKSESLDVKQAGAKGDDSTDDTLAIQAAFDSGVKNITVSGGTYIISASVQPAAGQTVTWFGEFKLKGGLATSSGNVPNSVLSVVRDNVTLVNPKIDGNRTNITDDNGQSGVHSCIAAYGSGGNDNLRIFGGVIKNGIHNILQGTGRNALVKGVVMENSGEHNVYLNETDGSGGSLGSRFTFKDCVLKAPFIDSGLHSEGHYFQLRNSKVVVIDNCDCSGAGTGGSSAPTFAVLAENMDELIVNNSKFTDLTNRILFIDSGRATFNDCEFDVLSGIATLSMMTATGADKVTFNRCVTNAYYQNTSLGPAKLVLKDCDITHATAFAIDMDADITGCTFNGSSTETWVDVSAGTANIRDNTFKGSAFRLTTSGTGSASIQGNSFPAVTTGSYHIQIGSTSGWAQVIGNNFPLSTSTSAIRISGAVTTEVIVGGNYLPTGTINDLSTNATLYGNVTV